KSSQLQGRSHEILFIQQSPGASQAADAVDKSSQKDSNSLMIFFDEKGVVENWVR
ncbi:hypothetical protein QIH25_10010, partial [Klebsiella pneumoniae]|nr:hypothetical protein [Klebsiella pneumoniae]